MMTSAETNHVSNNEGIEEISTKLVVPRTDEGRMRESQGIRRGGAGGRDQDRQAYLLYS